VALEPAIGSSVATRRVGFGDCFDAGFEKPAYTHLAATRQVGKRTNDLFRGERQSLNTLLIVNFIAL
jgi:hypothetical protein